MPLPSFSDLNAADGILGETDGNYAVSRREENRDAAARLVAQARRQVDLFTPDLEPALYDQANFVDALANIVVNHSRARIRILVKDFERAVKEGHRLMETARRLSSYIEIRRAHEDYRDSNESFLLVDDYGLLHRRHAARFDGVFSYKAPLEVRRLRANFDEIWARSEADADTRRLHL